MTEVNQPRKYLFDLAFDGEEGAALPEMDKPKPTYSEEQLEAAKKEAYESGLAAGKKAQLAAQEQQIAALLAKVEKQAGALIQESTDVWARQITQLHEVAFVIARKILPSYVAHHGMDEIEALIDRVLSDMSREPRLVIRIAEASFDDASAKINALAANQAFAGKLVLLSDPDLGVSDCRVEWADGGIERDTKAIWEEIDRIMEENRAPDPEEAVASAPEPVAASQTQPIEQNAPSPAMTQTGE